MMDGTTDQLMQSANPAVDFPPTVQGSLLKRVLNEVELGFVLPVVTIAHYYYFGAERVTSREEKSPVFASGVLPESQISELATKSAIILV
jgi:hypothetical protein